MSEQKQAHEYTIDQTRLARQFNKYFSVLLARKLKNPELYPNRSVQELKDNLKKFDPKNWHGFCNGITTLLMGAKALSQRQVWQASQGHAKPDQKLAIGEDIHNFDKFLTYFRAISAWDGEDASLTGPLEQLFEQCLNRINTFQDIMNITPLRQPLSYQHLECGTPNDGYLILEKHTSYSTLFDAKLDKKFDQHDAQLDALVDMLDSNGLVKLGFREVVLKRKWDFSKDYHDSTGHAMGAFKNGAHYCLLDSNLEKIVYFTPDKRLFKHHVFTQGSIVRGKSDALLYIDMHTLNLVRKDNGAACLPPPPDALKARLDAHREHQFTQIMGAESDKFPDKTKALKEWLNLCYIKDDYATAFFILKKLDDQYKHLALDIQKWFYFELANKKAFKEILAWMIKENTEASNKTAIQLLEVMTRKSYDLTFPTWESSYDIDGNGLLALAVKYRNNTLFTELLAHADVNAKNYHGETPLHRAIKTGQAEFMQQLIDAGAQLPAKDKKGMGKIALTAALKNNQPDLVRQLLRAGVLPQPSDMHAAITGGHVDVVAQLIAMGQAPDSTCGDMPLLLLAITHRQQDVAQLLLGPLCYNGFTPGDAELCKAAQNGDAAMLNLLLANGYKPSAPAEQKGDDPRHEPFRLALTEGHKAAAELLLNHSKYKPSLHPNDLFHAAKLGSRSILEKLAESDMDFNTTNAEGRTVLHILMLHGHHELVAEVRQFATINASKKDNYGHSADYYREHPMVVKPGDNKPSDEKSSLSALRRWSIYQPAAAAAPAPVAPAILEPIPVTLEGLRV